MPKHLISLGAFHVKVLMSLACMQGNVIKSTQGVQLLRNLEELDLRCNLISSIHEVVRLSGMHMVGMVASPDCLHQSFTDSAK